MPELHADPDHEVPDLFNLLRDSATEQILGFFADPKMTTTRSKLRRGDYGLDGGMACRMAVLEQIGTLGTPGLRLGLLVFSLEVVLQLVRWDRVVVAINQPDPIPERSMGSLVKMLERLDFG